MKILLFMSFNIDHATWEQSALDRERWQSAVHKGANTCETNRIAAAEGRRQARKNRANNPVAGATIPCQHCQRLFRVQIGLTSHLWTHKKRPPPPQDDEMVFVASMDKLLNSENYPI
uniref:C2H2-type domain-containing protein n=1 Tax=Octopus bimaculoides TaxID=37653 RepID=A0A0L8H3L1_OCTBM